MSCQFLVIFMAIVKSLLGCFFRGNLYLLASCIPSSSAMLTGSPVVSDLCLFGGSVSPRDYCKRIGQSVFIVVLLENVR